MLTLEKYTIGVGDRFAHQAKAQLQACVKLAENGIDVIPVWNKSNREHIFIGSEPQSVYDAAKAAVEALFRTDLALKSSRGDGRIVIEQLVLELCGVRRDLRRG